ncbi:MAG: hypothetical protein ACOY3K_01580 [Candidatus Omnitrophota bacterium]
MLQSSGGVANEVLPETGTEVLIRNHPKTGQPYPVIADPGEPRDDLRSLNPDKYERPDYRYLDPNLRSGTIRYDGPYSSRTKVYVFAASMATLGVVGGTLLPVAPAAAGAAGGGGAAAAGIAGSGVVATTGIVSSAVLHKDDDKIQDFARIQETRLIEAESDFYKLYVDPGPETSHVS